MLAHYETKINIDKLRKLSIPDEVEIKNNLINKYKKEYQGIRLPSMYDKQFDKISQDELQQVSEEIKKRLGF